MPRTFRDQVVVITGASSGIGWALAKELARDGCRLGLIARREDKLSELAQEIGGAGVQTAVAAADVAEREQVLSAIGTLRERLGPVDLLVANAGVGTPTLLDPVNVADVEKMVRVNLLGVVYSIAAVLPDMLRRGQGHLAAVSSMAAYMGLPGESGYCSTKAAVNSYMDGLRIQLRTRGIAVTTICPGFIRTPMTAVNEFHMPWLLEPDDAARRIARALRRRKTVYNFPWQMGAFMAVVRRLPDWVVSLGMREYNEKPPMAKQPL